MLGVPGLPAVLHVMVGSGRERGCVRGVCEAAVCALQERPPRLKIACRRFVKVIIVLIH